MSQKDEGWYTCQLSNDQGKTHNSGYVTILEEPPPDPADQVAKAQLGAGIAVVAAVFIVIGVVGCCFRK